MSTDPAVVTPPPPPIEAAPFADPAPNAALTPAPAPVDTVLIDLTARHEKLKFEHEKVKAAYSQLCRLLGLAQGDMNAFISQVDKEGLGMKTVTDHRKRVEKWLAQLGKETHSEL